MGARAPFAAPSVRRWVGNPRVVDVFPAISSLLIKGFPTYSSDFVGSGRPWVGALGGSGSWYSAASLGCSRTSASNGALPRMGNNPTCCGLVTCPIYINLLGSCLCHYSMIMEYRDQKIFHLLMILCLVTGGYSHESKPIVSSLLSRSCKKRPRLFAVPNLFRHFAL